MKVLSTAGTGVKRDNEKREALGNINRFITMDKMKQEDGQRAATDKQRRVGEVRVEHRAPPPEHIEDDKSYDQVKREQIKISSERTTFLSNAPIARIPKSPEPFRGKHRDLSEPRPPASEPRPSPPPPKPQAQPRQSRQDPPKKKPPPPPPTIRLNDHDHDLPPAANERKLSANNQNKLDNILAQIKFLDDEEKQRIFLALFHEMSFSAKSSLMAEILSELKLAPPSSREAGQAAQVRL